MNRAFIVAITQFELVILVKSRLCMTTREILYHIVFSLSKWEELMLISFYGCYVLNLDVKQMPNVPRSDHNWQAYSLEGAILGIYGFQIH